MNTCARVEQQSSGSSLDYVGLRSSSVVSLFWFRSQEV